MNNKLRIFLSMLIAASLVTMQTSAAVLSGLRAEYSFADKAVTVSADVDNSVGDKAGEVVIKLVGGKDTDLDANTALLIAADVAAVGEQTSITHKIGLKPDLAEGKYNVYLSGSGVEPADTYFWYYTDTTIAAKTQLVADATSSTMEKVLFEDKLIDGEYYDLADELSLKNSFYAQSSDSIIARIAANEAASIENWNDLKTIFNTASVMAAFESNNIAAVTDADYNFKASIFADANPASKIQQIYEASDAVTTDGKQQMLSMLSGKSWSKLADFEKDLAKHVLYAAVYNATTEGYGHIPQLMDDLAALAGYNTASYNALSGDNKLAVASAVLAGNASSPEAMLAAIDDAIEDVNDDKSGGSSGSSSGSSSGGGGSRGSSTIGVSGGYVAELKDQSNAMEDAYMNGFADLDGCDWAKEAVIYLADNGIVSGTGSNNYSPDRSITREEFAKMLTLVMGYDTTGTAEFADVPTGSWYQPYVAALAANDITRGVGDGKFGVGTPITRQECCTLIYRALGGEGGAASNFSDSDSIAAWAAQAVGAMSEKGIIKGYEDGSFKPENNITRAEAAVVFYRMIKGGIAG